MDGSDLLAVDQQRQAQVDGVLDCCFSLAKNRAVALGMLRAARRRRDTVLGRLK
jgi:hypothetical protein